MACGADINQRDNNGENALFDAIVRSALLPVFNWLMEHWIDILVRTKKEWLSVLQWLRGPDEKSPAGH